MPSSRRFGALLLGIPLAWQPLATQDARPGDEAGGRAVGIPVPGLDSGTLRAACLDLYGRPPLEGERQTWLGKARHAWVDGALANAESWRFWLEEQLYYFLLIDNFRPESERVESIPDALAQGRLNVRDAIHRVALSPSFDQRNPGADTFVTVVMEQLVGMRVQKHVRELEIGKAIYDGRPGSFLGKTGSTQADIVRIAIEDRSFAQTFLAREHRRILGADPEPKALAEWVRQFQRDAGEYRSILRGWLLSPEWDARRASKLDVPNRIWVRMLYVDLLGRLPDEDEARRLRSALDGLSDAGPLRAVFARILIDSGQVHVAGPNTSTDRARWVSELFERLLGRAPRESELAAFVETMKDPACSAELVLRAIVTHPEYPTY
jgi:hypothetical protein